MNAIAVQQFLKHTAIDDNDSVSTEHRMHVSFHTEQQLTGVIRGEIPEK